MLSFYLLNLTQNIEEIPSNSGDFDLWNKSVLYRKKSFHFERHVSKDSAMC